MLSPGHAAVTGAGKEAVTGLSLAAAARRSACVVPATAGPGGSSRAMSTAAVVPPRPGPGPGWGDRRDRRRRFSGCHPAGGHPKA